MTEADMISLLMPSRGRPGDLAGMWASARETADLPDRLELVARLDDDDPAEYPDLPGAAYLVRGPRIVLSRLWNEACAAASGSILWHGGDDNLFRTEGWDTMVREALAGFPDGIAFVHGQDGLQEIETIGTAGFVTRRWVEVSGFFMPPYFSSDMNDLWLTEVADAIGRRVLLPGMLIEHMHYIAGKHELDATHRDRLERGTRDNVYQLYGDLAGERTYHVRRLRMAMA